MFVKIILVHFPCTKIFYIKKKVNYGMFSFFHTVHAHKFVYTCNTFASSACSHCMWLIGDRKKDV